jgi:hypothetical protein
MEHAVDYGRLQNQLFNLTCRGGATAGAGVGILIVCTNADRACNVELPLAALKKQFPQVRSRGIYVFF